MARNYLLYSQNDVTTPPDAFEESGFSTGGKTVPEDNDPQRRLDTQPEMDKSNRRRLDNLAEQDLPATGRRDTRSPRNDDVYDGMTVVGDEIEMPRMEKSRVRSRRVVGWMVGVQGPCRGVDFRLHEGKNYIGRSPRCEVNVEDLKVSGGNVAQVVFDPRSKRFFTSDCDGTSTICYLNGETLMGRNQLKLYDAIELGDSKLIFVPLCGEHFSWTENEGE